jgi:hypothetical protein
MRILLVQLRIAVMQNSALHVNANFPSVMQISAWSDADFHLE